MVVIVLMAIGIHSCQASQAENALKDYNAQVNSLISASDTTGSQLLDDPRPGVRQEPHGGLHAGQRRPELSDHQLTTAQGWSVPSAMQSAHSKLVFALTMRRDGIDLIGSHIEAALGTTDRQAAFNAIAQAGARFYASDVTYKSYSLPEMVAALNGAGIAVGGVNGVTVNGGQFLTDLGGCRRRGSPPSSAAPASSSGSNSAAPGPCTDTRSTRSASAGRPCVPGVTNYVAATPAPTFTLNITNGGTFNEYNVVCKVSVEGLSDTGSYTIPQTTAGETTTCDVTLPSSPPSGTYNVTAEVVPVPGETNTANNYADVPGRLHRLSRRPRGPQPRPAAYPVIRERSDQHGRHRGDRRRGGGGRSRSGWRSGWRSRCGDCAPRNARCSASTTRISSLTPPACMAISAR